MSPTCSKCGAEPTQPEEDSRTYGPADALPPGTAVESRPRPTVRIAPPPARPMVLTVFIVLYGVTLAFICACSFQLLLDFLLLTPTAERLAGVALIILSGLVFVTMRTLWDGKRSAHTATTVLVTLQVFGEIALLFGESGGHAVHLVFLCLQVAFLVVLWLPDSRAYANW